MNVQSCVLTITITPGVDDICTAVREDSVQEFQDHLNSIEPSIKLVNWNLRVFWTLKLPVMKMAV